MGFLDTILGVIFPENCLSCGTSETPLCTTCLTSFPQAERECAKWINPLFDYRHEPVKSALWRLKYKGQKRLARVFGEVLYPRMLEELADLLVMENFREPVLVPIPLSSKRYRERGFNQADLICRKLVELDQENKEKNFKLEEDILVRPRESEHQARIEDRKKRLANIVGAFSVKNPKVIENKNIILIDDIITTGATLSEARKVLRAAGARKVIAFTIAH